MTTRIKSIRLKGRISNTLGEAALGYSRTQSVCENGRWLAANFRFSEQNMRWERTASAPPLLKLHGPLNLAPGAINLIGYCDHPGVPC